MSSWLLISFSNYNLPLKCHLRRYYQGQALLADVIGKDGGGAAERGCINAAALSISRSMCLRHVEGSNYK